MKKITLSLLISFILVSFSQAADYTVKLQSGNYNFNQEGIELSLEAFTETHQTSYSIVQFFTIPTEVEKKRFESKGIKLLDYLPENAFIAFIESPSQVTFKSLNVKAAVPYLSKYKYSKQLANKEHPEWALRAGNKVALMVESHINVAKEDFEAFLISNQITITNTDPSGVYFEIALALSQIETIANSELVKFIDYIQAPPEKEDVLARSLHRGNLLDSDHPLGRKYDGSGVSIAIADDADIGPHIDLQGRFVSFATGGNGTHGDMTTGIAVGAGNLNPDYVGTATGAFLYYYLINGYPHISNAVTNLTNRGVVITSTSFSEGCNAGYTGTTRVVDQQTRQNPSLIHIFSAGNSASSTCGTNAYGAGTPWGTITGGRKMGKNVIAVANLTSDGFLTGSSSRGPASDGRIKPDISANGTNQISTAPNNTYQVGGGTSAAAPSIAGLTAQLYHGYRSINNNATPDAALIKNALLNTTRDLGNVGPDFTYGWGRVNTHRAMKLLEENRYLDTTISQNGFNSHNIVIPSSLRELRFMIYWTDYEASTVANKALVNDIDIRVVTPNGDTILPWILDPTPNATAITSPATRGIDDLNNMEQVFIDTAAAGTYRVLVNGKAIPQGPQKYFLTWETRPDEVQLTYPNGGESFTPGTSENIRWDAVGTTGGYRLEYSLNGGSTWTTITIVSGTTRSRSWIVPNNVTGNALIRVTKMLSPTLTSFADTSDYSFSIIGVPNNITEDFVCTDSIKISWDSVPGATAYQVHLLGTNYMDSIGVTSATNFTLTGIQNTNDNWVSVKALGNSIEGKRAIAVLLSKTFDNCPLDYDVAISELISPNDDYLYNCNLSKFAVKAVVSNFGDSTLQNIPLNYILNGVTYRDTLQGPLMKDSSIVFTFSDSINAITNSLNSFEVNAILAQDQFLTNNSILQNFRVLSNGFVNLPNSENFDSNILCATTTNCGGTTCNLNSIWQNMPNNSADDFDMRVNQGGTASQNTGPTGDHTSGNGRYIYAEASNNCYEVSSHVVSNCIDLTNTISPELDFWYHMFGANTGSLHVDIYSEGSWIKDFVPSIEGNQGSSWINQKVDLSQLNGKTVTIRLRVVTGSFWASDIAIDDISLTDIAVGIEENRMTDNVKIYPNPSNGLIQIEMDQLPNKDFIVYDLNGRVIKRFKATSRNFNVDLSSLNKGIYFITLEDYSIREKLILH
tara:strand:- start:5183 stop:8770 length:3588 start_codon:yes stop_codon:yes gene_type:complete